MTTLDKYIISAFVKNLALAVVALASLYLFQALLAELLDQEFPTQQILIHNLLGMPQVIVQMIPPGVLVATVLTISGLNRTNELIACYSIGYGVNRIVGVIMSVVMMVSILSLFMQDKINPPLFKKQTTYYWREMKKRADFFLDVKQNKIWYRSKNLIYNLRTFDSKTRTIHGMSIYTFDENFNMLQTIEASSAEFTRNGWQLLDGTVTVFAKDDPFPLTQTFKQKELVIAESPKDFQEIEKEVDGLGLKDLYRYIQHTRETGIDTKSFEVKFHSRISLSFIPLVMCILGVPFSTRSRRQGGLAKDLGLCLAVTFFYWLFYSVGLSLGTNGALPPWLAAWLPSTVFVAVAVTLIARQQRA